MSAPAKRPRLRLCSQSAKLHVWWASGEELVAIPVKDLTDVRSLKQQLQQLCGAPRFRQRLLQGTDCLADDQRLVEAGDVQLVVLPFVSASQQQELELITAARDGQLAEVESILCRPQEPDVLNIDFQNRRPLDAASSAGHAEIVRLLLEAKADKDAISFASTPLTMAAAAGHVEVVRILSDAGAKIDRVTRGITPLLLGIGNGHVDVVRQLLLARASPSLGSNLRSGVSK